MNCFWHCRLDLDSSKDSAFYNVLNEGWYHSNSKFFLLVLNLDINFQMILYQISACVLRPKNCDSYGYW